MSLGTKDKSTKSKSIVIPRLAMASAHLFPSLKVCTLDLQSSIMDIRRGLILESLAKKETTSYTLSGAKKFSFRQIKFILGWWSKLKLNDGLNAWPKAISEDPRNPLYFMPWA